MAKMAKARSLSAKAKTKGVVKQKPSAKKEAPVVAKKLKVVEAAPAKQTASTTAPATADAAAANKKVSQKLLETIERRKKLQEGGGRSSFGRPPGRPGRRGRRPKSMSDYTPSTQEEDSYVLESDYEGLEYDTGIRLKDNQDDSGFSLDRADEFDEELNFDR